MGGGGGARQSHQLLVINGSWDALQDPREEKCFGVPVIRGLVTGREQLWLCPLWGPRSAVGLGRVGQSPLVHRSQTALAPSLAWPTGDLTCVFIGESGLTGAIVLFLD